MHKSELSDFPPLQQPAIELDLPLIAQLGTHHRDPVEAHLLRLSDSDRRLRFGHQISQDVLAKYVRSIQFFRDAAFGAFDESGNLVGFGHLAFGDAEAEFAVSVERDARGRGVGRALLVRAAEHARNRGQRVLTMVYMSNSWVEMLI